MPIRGRADVGVVARAVRHDVLAQRIRPRTSVTPRQLNRLIGYRIVVGVHSSSVFAETPADPIIRGLLLLPRLSVRGGNLIIDSGNVAAQMAGILNRLHHIRFPHLPDL